MGVYDQAVRGLVAFVCEVGRPLFTLCEHLVSSVDLFAVHVRLRNASKADGCEGPRAPSMAGCPCDMKSLVGPDLELYPEAVELPEALEEGG